MRARLAALAVFTGLSLSGCSWLGGWFGSDAPKVKPADLVDFAPSVVVSRAWDVGVGAGRPFTFSPASDGQAVYAASREGRIVKIDPASGRESLRIDTAKPLSAGVGVGGGLVVVGTPKGELLAYRTADGQPAWTARLSGEILTPPALAGGMVAARDGKQRWVYSRALPPLTLREPGGLVLGDRAVYAGFPGGKLAALSLVNGAPVWEANVALPRGATELERIADVAGVLAIDAQLICAAAYQGRVACFDRISGNLAWGREFSALKGVAMDRRSVYAADEAGSVQAFERQRGVSPWKQDKLRDRGLSAPLALDRYVTVGDFQGHVHLLDSDTGAFAARVATDGSPIVGAMLATEQGFVVQTANGGVYGFRIQESGVRNP